MFCYIFCYRPRLNCFYRVQKIRMLPSVPSHKNKRFHIYLLRCINKLNATVIVKNDRNYLCCQNIVTIFTLNLMFLTACIRYPCKLIIQLTCKTRRQFLHSYATCKKNGVLPSFNLRGERWKSSFVIRIRI